MSNIIFTFRKERIAAISHPDNQKPLHVGAVVEYEEFATGTTRVNIELNKDLPDILKEAIEKNPSCLKILEKKSDPENVMIIPNRPDIIV